jgi:hypothetical protein
VAVPACLGALAVVAAGCGAHAYAGLVSHPARPAGALVASSTDGRTRTAKARLIDQLQRPPRVVIFGGSRAMRFDPAYIRRRTGLTGFNAAVTHAWPEDTWALLNLLHTRFPHARFRFLWVIHGDEFVRRPIDAAVLLDPALSRYFPSRLVQAQLPGAIARARGTAKTIQIDIPRRGRLVYAPDGYVVSGFFSNGTPPPNGHPGAIAANIGKELRIYATNPVTPFRQSVRYFGKDLGLMDSLAAARPVVVAAPFDRRIYTATVHRGWGARHRRLLALLARFHDAYRFSFLDLSRSAAHGFVPGEFYDGIHLTPRGARRVVDLVLERFPRAL